MDPSIERLIEKAKADERVLAVMLFGSRARGEDTAESDLDVCLVLPPGRDTRHDQVAVRLEYLASSTGRLDIRIFQQLPLYVRRRVLREGVVLFCKDLDTLYALACRTAQAFEDFKPIYHHYLEQVARAGS
jgi:predicted nucleotidyltransferase